MERLITLGTIAVFVGIILIFIGSLLQATKPSKTGKAEVKSAGIILIGPFPFGWASDKQMFYTLIAIVVIMIILYLLFFRRM